MPATIQLHQCDTQVSTVISERKPEADSARIYIFEIKVRLLSMSSVFKIIKQKTGEGSNGGAEAVPHPQNKNNAVSIMPSPAFLSSQLIRPAVSYRYYNLVL